MFKKSYVHFYKNGIKPVKVVPTYFPNFAKLFRKPKKYSYTPSKTVVIK